MRNPEILGILMVCIRGLGFGFHSCLGICRFAANGALANCPSGCAVIRDLPREPASAQRIPEAGAIPISGFEQCP